MEYDSGSESSGSDITPIFWDIETTGLNPNDKRVVCVGVGYMEDGSNMVDVFSGSSEYHMFSRVREHCTDLINRLSKEGDVLNDMSDVEKSPVVIVSNYGRGFDHPFYTARCCGIYRQNPYPFGYREMRLDVSRVDGFYGSQDDMVERRGIEVGPEDNIDGSDVPDLWDDGETEVIENHCHSDVLELMELYRHEEETMVHHVKDHYDLE